MTGLWFLHSAIPLMALYQCIKFHLITFNSLLQTKVWRTDIQMVGPMDKVVTICSPFGELRTKVWWKVRRTNKAATIPSRNRQDNKTYINAYYEQQRSRVCVSGKFTIPIQSWQMSQGMTKPTKWHVRPAKTEISLGIHPIWSESLLSTWRKLGP